MALVLTNTEIAFRSQSDASLQRSYWLFRLIGHPWLVALGTRLMGWALALRLPVEWLIRATVFRQFCGGENLQESLSTVDRLAQFGIGTILDYSVEASQSEEAFAQNARVLHQTIALAAQDRRIPFCVFKVTALARFALLEKHDQEILLEPDEESEWARARERVAALCRHASEAKVRLFFDAEESWIQDTVDDLAYEQMAHFNRQEPLIYNTVQTYRVDSLNHLKALQKHASEKGFFVGLKIVRGAYMEKERARAERLGKESPIHATKAKTDEAFDTAVDFVLAHLDRMALCAGTHNEKSTLHLAQEMDRLQIARQDPRVYFAQLLGMSDHLSFNLSSENYRVAKYVPFGPVRAVFPYLVRRARENTSVAGQTTRELALIRQERLRRGLGC
ncbi:proline dehydrogenase family protein [bacterium]|nr:proline dehydrogenase family protein [bacterium]